MSQLRHSGVCEQRECFYRDVFPTQPHRHVLEFDFDRYSIVAEALVFADHAWQLSLDDAMSQSDQIA